MNMKLGSILGVLFVWKSGRLEAFSPSFEARGPASSWMVASSQFALYDTKSKNEWTSDFDDYIGNDNDSSDFAKLFQERVVGPADLTAIKTRQFVLGTDIALSGFVGVMGFDEVTDWEYYYQDEQDPRERKVVQPNPFDSATPRRTRTASGSVVRVFRGSLVGPMGATLRAQGLDARVIIKEFTGILALSLARAELDSTGKLQSDLVVAASRQDAVDGDWIRAAAARSAMARQDNAHVVKLLQMLAPAPFLGILGEVNLAELDMSPNDFYRELGVAPPKPEAIWVVYEYAGLSTLSAYAEPALVRRSKIPPKRGFFGVVEPPRLPLWKNRANYMVNGIMKGAIEAVACLHESGLVHRSIGKTSLILSSKTMDKAEAASLFATLTSQLIVKIADFGFSGQYNEASSDQEFCTRARTFGLNFRKGDNNVATTNFAIAEDMHALGFVFLALLLSSLAELPDSTYRMPATDEDSLQRLFGDIFEKDINQFRDYVEAEEIWSDLVGLLDDRDAAGWKVLETLLLAREKAAKNKDTSQIFTVRGLLSNPFFS
jgi:hypothetical protein